MTGESSKTRGRRSREKMKIHNKAFYADYHNTDLDVNGRRRKAKKQAKRLLSKTRRRWEKRIAEENCDDF